ncbi:indolepyruvate ferredoxin oxidoreductase subunit alpha [Fodinicurvata sp. EGI_FJ10296]|uniref:indolepyruvate ferredoxin oxidoreductase subunit alpha n=1 Tax=Fodinicurvata sp. EGI_FJ10296 TaxID=3231908 RepID=UPI0034555200
MERSYSAEIELLKRGDGEVFEGEGILAITKALLQSGVGYVSGYQGAPVSHLMDVLSTAKPFLDELGVHYEPAANEAGSAAMLAASINYPIRGAAIWKSVVGTNVASDALSNLASAGVVGGALIIVGEDYGEGASIIQERTHAFAMKSSMWLMDPRPDHTRFVDLIEKSFEFSEATSTPVIMEFRIRACHMHGRFETRDNKSPRYSAKAPLENPDFDYNRICLPPSTYVQEQDKVTRRFPEALKFIRDNALNDHFDGRYDDVGIICQGGLHNTVMRALAQLGLADGFGGTDIPILALNVTYPLLPDEISGFCAGKRSVLVVEEGFPAYIEDAVNTILRKADLNTTVIGKGVLPEAGEYVADVMLKGLGAYLEGAVPRGVDLETVGRIVHRVTSNADRARSLIGGAVPSRPPTFCTGCPERPVFTAMELTQRQIGKFHVSADIGCHSFSTLPPFNIGNSILGYGLGLASANGVRPALGKRVVSVMGDGGFWHNGLTSGVSGAVQNGTDGVLVVLNNGYSSATGQQTIPSSKVGPDRKALMTIEDAVKSFGVSWVRTINSYKVGDMVSALKEAVTSKAGGLKVIVADGECQLARQRRVKVADGAALKRGERVVRTRFGVDETVCTGDHACIRLSGCPSLTVKESADPLRTDPVAHVNNDCVGCGLCGEVADAAALCPSFYRADIIRNPGRWDRFMARLRNRVIGSLQGFTARRAEV